MIKIRRIKSLKILYKLVKKINYIAEISLPSKSAYSIHVMKMCAAFSKSSKNTSLYIFNKKKKINFFKIYNCKKKFNIISFDIEKINFFSRIIFSLKIISKIKKKCPEQIFYSRSIITAIFLALYKRKVSLEIHHELVGFTHRLFNLSKNFKFFQNIRFIFLTKNLQKHYKLTNKSIILDDAVELENFDIKDKSKKIKNTAVYCGSFAKGKGLETILSTSKLTRNIKYHLYGDFSNSLFTLKDLDKYKNVKYMGFANYNKIPIILNKYSLYLMPYSKKVHVRSKNIEVGKYMSPMKLFEYMASDGTIIASYMNVYRHILDNKNSILIKKNLPSVWKMNIENFFKNRKKFNKLSKNAMKKVKNFTWDKRVDKILEFLNV